MPSLRRIRSRAASPTLGERPGAWPALRPFVGPAAIVIAVVVVLHQLLFGGAIATHIDLMSFWLPQFCFLGKALAAGHIPAWNPHVMTGVPFAADPQSGWLNLPAMLLFAVAPCGSALRLYLFLQPVIGGLGLYAFLRTDGTSRTAATAGGFVWALVIAGSFIGPYVPFSSSLAWTAVLLAAAARYVRSPRWSGRLGWLLAAGMAWGQVAAAHFSDGTAIATMALAIYVAARSFTRVRQGVVGWKPAVGRVVLVFPVLALVNLAFLVPRLSYLSRTSLGLGYGRLNELSQQFTGHEGHTFFTGYQLGPSWPFDLLLSPGLYLGAAGLALVCLGWASREHRAVVAVFTGFAAVCYVLSIDRVAVWLKSLSSSTIGGAYIHAPSRFRFAVLLATAVLIGYGVEGWKTARSTRGRLLLLAPGVLLWWGGALLFARPMHDLLLPLVAGVLAGVVLAATIARPGLAFLIPVLIGAELVANGLAAYPGAASTYPGPVELDSWLRPPGTVEIVHRQGNGRYLSFAPHELTRSGGYLGYQEPVDAPFLANGQSILFDLREAQGYNPVQLLRYWEYFRFRARVNANYNASFLKEVYPQQLDLLQVSTVILRAARKKPFPGASRIAVVGDWQVLRVQHPAGRASLLRSCRSAPTPGAALRAVYAPAFDPRREVVLDSGPDVSCGPSSPGGTVRYRDLGPQEAEIHVQTPAAGVLLVRDSWDEGWHASVDGRPEPVLHADFLLQGVPVPPGRHTVILRYDDPAVGLGLLGTVVVVLLLVGAIVAARLVERRRPASPEQEAPSPESSPERRAPAPTAPKPGE